MIKINPAEQQDQKRRCRRFDNPHGAFDIRNLFQTLLCDRPVGLKDFDLLRGDDLVARHQRLSFRNFLHNRLNLLQRGLLLFFGILPVGCHLSGGKQLFDQGSQILPHRRLFRGCERFQNLFTDLFRRLVRGRQILQLTGFPHPVVDINDAHRLCPRNILLVVNRHDSVVHRRRRQFQQIPIKLRSIGDKEQIVEFRFRKFRHPLSRGRILRQIRNSPGERLLPRSNLLENRRKFGNNLRRRFFIDPVKQRQFRQHRRLFLIGLRLVLILEIEHRVHRERCDLILHQARHRRVPFLIHHRKNTGRQHQQHRHVPAEQLVLHDPGKQRLFLIDLAGGVDHPFLRHFPFGHEILKQGKHGQLSLDSVRSVLFDDGSDDSLRESRS